MTAHQQRMRALLALPGVVRVGLGCRETAGRVRPEWCYRVYVARKRPLRALAPGERIPPAIDGIPTDVHVADTRRLAGEAPPPLFPGQRITRYAPGKSFGFGTVGMLVKRGAAPNEKSFLMTCAHVLRSNFHLFPNALEVYSPEHKSCACRSPVADLTMVPHPGFEDGDPDPTGHRFELFKSGDQTFWLDVALAPTRAGISGSNFVPGQGALHKDSLDLSKTPGIPAFDSVAHPENGKPSRQAKDPFVTVSKFGATTGPTSGRVVELSCVKFVEGADNDPSNPGDVWEMVVRSQTPNYLEEFELADGEDVSKVVAHMQGKPVTCTPLGGQRLRLQGARFCDSGDSGSVVFDKDRKVVGILNASRGIDMKVKRDGNVVEELLPNGLGAVCYIRPIFEAFGLSDASIMQPGQLLAGATVAVPREGLGIGAVPGLPEAIEQARQTEAGTRFVDLVMSHREQVARLIHHRRRVTVLWHRNKGPAFAARVIDALADPDTPLPRALGGVTLADALAKFRLVLAHEGDQALRRDLATHADWMIDLVLRTTTLRELQQLLGAAVTKS